MFFSFFFFISFGYKISLSSHTFLTLLPNWYLYMKADISAWTTWLLNIKSLEKSKSGDILKWKKKKCKLPTCRVLTVRRTLKGMCCTSLISFRFLSCYFFFFHLILSHISLPKKKFFFFKLYSNCLRTLMCNKVMLPLVRSCTIYFKFFFTVNCFLEICVYLSLWKKYISLWSPSTWYLYLYVHHCLMLCFLTTNN